MINKWDSNNHIMVDLETLGNQNSSVIMSISLVRFNPFTGGIFENLNLNISIDSSLVAGAEVKGETLMWWFEQEELARKTIIEGQKDALEIYEALILISDFVKKIEDEIGMEMVMWGNGSSFDLGILSHQYHLCLLPEPWQHWNERDVRTIVDFAPDIKSKTVFEGTKHIPYFDACHQIKYVSETIQYILKPHLN